jgi:carboxyl-terminal processing protease
MRNLPKIRPQPRLNLTRVAQARFSLSADLEGKLMPMKRVWSPALWVLVPILAAAVLAAPSVRAEEADKKDGAKDDYYTLMKTFVETFQQVERNYVKDIDRRELLQAAIEGMMSKLDPYSSYITPEEMTQFSESVDQEFGGIGIQIHPDERTHQLTVMSPLPGTPAYRAGLIAGDTITDVDGKSTRDWTVDKAVGVLKGKPGTSVKLGIEHVGSHKKDQVTLVRDVIHVATVLGDHYKPDGSWDYMIDKKDKIGYVRLTHFSRHSAIELEKAINTLLEEGMKGLVLDLRFDPGGLFSQATEIADMFIDGGTIVSTKGRNTQERVWEAKKEGTFPNFPMAIIVNHYSASASEIVAACLQDHHRAVIVGERSWGKGSVQNVIELENGTSALKLTTASYHRPSGKNIHRFPGMSESEAWGVMPDTGYEVKFTPRETREYMETYRRDRDILSKDGPPTSEFKDRQLDRALSAVRTKLAEVGKGAPKGDQKAKAAPVPEKKAAASRPTPAKRPALYGIG